MNIEIVSKVLLLVVAMAVGGSGSASAQASGADPHHPANAAQETPPGVQGVPGRGPQNMAGPDMMSMMGPGMMQPGMMQPGMMAGMMAMSNRGPMMKVLFAIADANGDGALSFEEMMV
ncbi:MAG: EF-hand domain-containing protein, partial [Neoaquamicrobium sediminum]